MEFAEVFEDLREYARIIRNEKTTSANTALRIGDMYLSIIDAMEGVYGVVDGISLDGYAKTEDLDGYLSKEGDTLEGELFIGSDGAQKLSGDGAVLRSLYLVGGGNGVTNVATFNDLGWTADYNEETGTKIGTLRWGMIDHDIYVPKVELDGYVTIGTQQTITGTKYFDGAYFNNVPFADVGSQSVRLATMNDVPSITGLLESGVEIARVDVGGQRLFLYAPTGGTVDLTNYYTKKEVEDYVGQEINTHKEEIAKVALTGSYNDLIDKPAIPSVVDSLVSDAVADALSAKQGKVLNDAVGELRTALSLVENSYLDKANPTVTGNMTVSGLLSAGSLSVGGRAIGSAAFYGVGNTVTDGNYELITGGGVYTALQGYATTDALSGYLPTIGGTITGALRVESMLTVTGVSEIAMLSCPKGLVVGDDQVSGQAFKSFTNMFGWNGDGADLTEDWRWAILKNGTATFGLLNAANLTLVDGGVTYAGVYHDDSWGVHLWNEAAKAGLGLTDDGIPHVNGLSILHVGNYDLYLDRVYARKATTLAGYGITDGVAIDNSNSADSHTKVSVGYGAGMNDYSGGIVTATLGDYGGQIHIPMNAAASMTYRGRVNGAWNEWKTILDSSNFSNYALPLSGGDIQGYIRAYNYRFINDSGSYLGLLTADANDENTLYFATRSGTFHALIHSGNIGSYALPKYGGTIDGELMTTGILSSSSYLSFGGYGGYFSSDVRRSWCTSIFGDSDNSSKLRIVRTDISLTDCCEIYGSGIVWRSHDTHGYLSVSYGSGQAFIGGGVGDVLNWSYTLIHSGNIGSYTYTKQQIDDKISALSGGNAFTGGSVVSSIYPSTNHGANLGTSSNWWNNLYVSEVNATAIELNTGGASGHGGYIDFHFNGSSVDYTSRIIEKVSGKVSIVGNAEVEGSFSATGNISAQGSFTGKGLRTATICYEVDADGNTSDYTGEINRMGAPLHLNHHSNTGIWMCNGGGNVLIGTTTDNGQKLQVNGKTNLDDILTVNYSNATRATGIEIQSTSGGESSIGFKLNDTTRFVVGCWSDSFHIWRSVGASSVLNINNSGNVTIGSSDLATTNYKLYVNGDSYVKGKLEAKAPYLGYSGACDVWLRRENGYSYINAVSSIMITVGNSSSNYAFGISANKSATLYGSLTVSGDILPSSTDTHSLGSTSSYWKNLYVGIITGHYQSGDVVKFSGSINATEGNVSCKSLTVNGVAITGGGSFNGGTVANATIFNDNVVIKGENAGFRMRTLTPTDIDFSYGQDYITLRGFSGTSVMWTIDSESGSADFNDYVAASSFEQSSDINLKNILGDVRLSLGTMANAPLVRFDWKNKVNKKHHVGTIAQYWQGALPEVVTKTMNGTLALSYGELGVAMGISLAKELSVYHTRVANVENDVQGLKEKVEELTRENEELRRQIEELAA